MRGSGRLKSHSQSPDSYSVFVSCSVVPPLRALKQVSLPSLSFTGAVLLPRPLSIGIPNAGIGAGAVCQFEQQLVAEDRNPPFNRAGVPGLVSVSTFLRAKNKGHVGERPDAEVVTIVLGGVGL